MRFSAAVARLRPGSGGRREHPWTAPPEQALANMLAGLTPSGDAPRQLRNLQEPVACVHAQMTSTGTVTVGWGIGTFEDRIGGRAEARVLLAHGQTDLTRRHGPGRLAG